MANLKHIAATLALLGSVSFMVTKEPEPDDFTGIMDGPEMLGFEFGTPIHEGEVLTRDQHAKRIGDLT